MSFLYTLANNIKTSVVGGPPPFPPTPPEVMPKGANLFPKTEPISSELVTEKKRTLTPPKKGENINPVASGIILGKVLSSTDLLNTNAWRLANLPDSNGLKLLVFGPSIPEETDKENYHFFSIGVSNASGADGQRLNGKELHKELIRFYKFVQDIKDHPENYDWEKMRGHTLDVLLMAKGTESLKPKIIETLNQKADNSEYGKVLLYYAKPESYEEMKALLNRFDPRFFLISTTYYTKNPESELYKKAIKEVLEQKPLEFRQAAKQHLIETLKYPGMFSNIIDSLGDDLIKDIQLSC